MSEKDPIAVSEVKPPVKRKRPSRSKAAVSSPATAPSNGSVKNHSNGTVKKGSAQGVGTQSKAKSVAPPETPPAETPAPQSATAVDRAEDTLDELGKKVGTVLAGAMTRLRKAAAVTREEFEDLWAEAQSIRRGDTK